MKKSATKPLPETATRHLGHCQICGGEREAGEFKLTDGGKLVHHGYKRPGTGYIYGDCYGVDHEPYEVSCETAKKYRAMLADHLVRARKSLATLKSGKTKHFEEMERSRWSRETVVTQYCVGVTEPYAWHRALEYRISHGESEVRNLTTEVAHFDKRIADWKPMPIRTIEERVAEERVAAAARATERGAKRAQKAAEEAAKKAKQRALAERRAAIAEDFAKQFRALAENPTANRHAAAALAAKLYQQKYAFILNAGIESLGCEEALVALGLAHRESDHARGWTYLYRDF